MTLETQDIDENWNINQMPCIAIQGTILWDKFQSLKTRIQLKCHANDERICVTSSVYNESDIG